MSLRHSLIETSAHRHPQFCREKALEGGSFTPATDVRLGWSEKAIAGIDLSFSLISMLRVAGLVWKRLGGEVRCESHGRRLMKSNTVVLIFVA